MTIDYVFKYSTERLNWSELSRHKNITIDIIQKYPYMRWHLKSIMKNPNITLDFLKYPNINNPKVTIWSMSDLENDELSHIYLNEHIPISELIKYAKQRNDLSESHISDYLILNPNLKLDETTDKMILSALDSSFHKQMYYPYQHPVNMFFVNRYRTVNLDWARIAKSSNITVEDILNNPDLPWINNWWNNPNVRLHHMIKQNITKPIKWNFLFFSP